MLSLLAAADLAHDVGHALDAGDDLFHRRAGLGHQGRALRNAVDTAADQALDLLGRLGAALGQAAHLTGHDREAAALVAGAGGFNRRVQSQDAGLAGDAVDDADDVGNLLAGVVNALHGRHPLAHPLAHHLAAPHGHRGRPLRQLAGLPGFVGVLFRGRPQLLHRRRRLLQGAGLLFAALAQVDVAAGNLRRQQAAGLASAVHVNAGAQVAGGHSLDHLDGLVQRPGDGPRQARTARS